MAARLRCGSVAETAGAEPRSWQSSRHGPPRPHRARSSRLRGRAGHKGTRVTLRTLLASLSDGDSIEDILSDYPTLTADGVRAVIAFAADSVRKDLPAPKIVGF
ncbi:DUF433 domain-containing protein [Sorangium sp. So ce1099]|uniref:DUF433 domain-containing protein n=1 Tax=Sorangium sp. So ce1099 TaxID=3133331 RepID=UPI003F602090